MVHLDNILPAYMRTEKGQDLWEEVSCLRNVGTPIYSTKLKYAERRPFPRNPSQAHVARCCQPLALPCVAAHQWRFCPQQNKENKESVERMQSEVRQTTIRAKELIRTTRHFKTTLIKRKRHLPCLGSSFKSKKRSSASHQCSHKQRSSFCHFHVVVLGRRFTFTVTN